MTSPLDSIGPYSEVSFEDVLTPDPNAYIPGDSIILAQEDVILRNLDRCLLLLNDLDTARSEETGEDPIVSDLVYSFFRTLEQCGYLLPTRQRMKDVRMPEHFFEHWLIHRLREG